MKILLAFLLYVIPSILLANNIHGVIKDVKGNVLPYSSVLIKGTAKGTTANSKGEFNLSVDNGYYVLVCQHIGFKSVERKIKISIT